MGETVISELVGDHCKTCKALFASTSDFERLSSTESVTCVEADNIEPLFVTCTLWIVRCNFCKATNHHIIEWN